jgi:hypothetical protein
VGGGRGAGAGQFKFSDGHQAAYPGRPSVCIHSYYCQACLAVQEPPQPKERISEKQHRHGKRAF